MRGRRAVAAFALPAVLTLTAACTSTSAENADPGLGRGASSSSPVRHSASASAVADPDHAVDPPGRLKGRLYTADMLIYSQDSLSAGMVRRIRAPRRASPRSSGCRWRRSASRTRPSTSRRSTRPATARGRRTTRRTPRRSGTGSPAGRSRCCRRCGSSCRSTRKGYLQLGSSKEAPDLHVGAFAPQIPNAVDAVVNEKWGKALHMKSGNALLVYTGTRSPSSLRRPVERIAGHTASVQSLDTSRGTVSTSTRRRRRSWSARSATRSARSTTASSAAAGSRRTRPGWPRTSPPSRCRSWATSPATG